MSGGERRGCKLGAAIVLTLCSVLAAYSSAAAQSPFGYAQDSILVRFKELAPPQERAQAHALAGARVHRTFRVVRGLQAVKIPPGMRVREALELYRRHPAVLYAEPNWIFRTQTTPSDPGLGDLWGLNNTGQNGGVPGADIGAELFLLGAYGTHEHPSAINGQRPERSDNAKGATPTESIAPCQNRQLYGLDLPALLAFAHLAFIASDRAFLKAGEIYLLGFSFLTVAGAVLDGPSPLFAAHLAF